MKTHGIIDQHNENEFLSQREIFRVKFSIMDAPFYNINE